MTDTRTVFFIGKPGCGKGTQAKLLAESTGWPIIASGAQFRAIVSSDTPVGRKVRSEMEQGKLAPHWFAMYLYMKALFDLPENSNVIFDGFNRKIAEAELVMSSLAWLGRPVSIVHIAVSDDSVRQRLALRKETSHRADDSVVDARLAEYYENTEPAINLFRTAGVLLEVDGEKSPEEIAADVRKVLTLE